MSIFKKIARAAHFLAVKTHTPISSAQHNHRKSSDNITGSPRFKTGDVYLHNKLGYRGVILYPLTTKSSFWDMEKKEIIYKNKDAYLGMLINDKTCKRSNMEKYLQIMAVHAAGEALEQAESQYRIPLEGFDVISETDVRPLILPEDPSIDSSNDCLIQHFFNLPMLTPKTEFIDIWKNCYDMEAGSYTLRHTFKDAGLTTEIYLYPCSYSVSYSVTAETTFRYRMNISTDTNLDATDSIMVGPILWQLQGRKLEEGISDAGDESVGTHQGNYVFFTRSDYHSPCELTSRRKSAQFCGWLNLPKYLNDYLVSPLFVARQIKSVEETDDTITFEHPVFEIKW